MQFSTFHSGRITFVLEMLVRLDQKTKQYKWEIYELQKYALHASIVIMLRFVRIIGVRDV